MAEHLSSKDFVNLFSTMERTPKVTIKQLQERSPFHRNTIAKAHLVASYLLPITNFTFDNEIIQDLNEKISGKYEIDQAYIARVCGYYSNWLASKPGTEIDRRLHIEEILDQVKHLRSCTSNPDLYMGINKTSNDDRHLYPLEIKKRDWRLDPKGWFHICTPDLSDRNKLGPQVSLLIDHLKESDFLKHYNELKTAVYELGDEIDNASNEISKSDASFRETWQYLVTNRPESASRIPDDPEPHREDYIPPGDQETNDSVIDKLGIKDIHPRYIKLERLLKNLSDDLNIKKIKETIKKGHCIECP